MDVLVNASLKQLRMSPKKVRLVVNVIRGMNAGKADAQLHFMNKAASVPVQKLLKSAVANATHNFKAEEDSLVVKEIAVDDGPTLHRWRPRARGRASRIRKRTSHIRIILSGKAPEPADKKDDASKAETKKVEAPKPKAEESKKETK